ncbi:NAD(P)/FAD-dependent oxidoreductase [Roseobacter ponti]|uniref:FAD-binding oxidoreductase n=1 Tax=Roseobacter ponti TaxID=1891787 RepID=A0A858SVK4_9RHOB|nr:FAD-binding oxidoreductase [Roseobacter ponti]QJF52310.1 FAD-binding oxidoreductase [Roseobacter ponti]
MTDILVIGGGIAGLSAAARLSEDAQVTVLEAEAATGYHASGRSAALIELNYGAESVRALNRAGFDFLRDSFGGCLSPRGLMILAREDEKEAFQSDLTSLGLGQIGVDEARAMVPVLDPQTVAFAGYHDAAHDIDTDRLLQGFARSLREGGGSIMTGARVNDIRFDGGQWQVSTPVGEFSAALLVNAAGAWADEVAVMAGVAPCGIVPYRRSMARVPAPDGHDPRSWPMFFGVGESWYAKPDAGALLVSPADEEPVAPQDAWAEDLTLAEGIARYEEMVTAPVTRMLSSWAGLRSFAPDRTLVLGRDPDQPAFVWCAGQGGYGFQTAPAASQLLADLVAGRASGLDAGVVDALTPGRLR